jgi:hypothetical protein
MTKDDADRQMVELKSENERLRALFRQSGIDTADASLASPQRDYRHERELVGERARATDAEEKVRLATARANLAEAKHTAWQQSTSRCWQTLSSVGRFWKTRPIASRCWALTAASNL